MVYNLSVFADISRIKKETFRKKKKWSTFHQIREAIASGLFCSSFSAHCGGSWLWCDPKSWISLVLPSWRQRVVLVYECRKLLRLPAVGLFSKERFSLLTRTEKGPACNWTTTSSGELEVGPTRATRPQFSADHLFPRACYRRFFVDELRLRKDCLWVNIPLIPQPKPRTG